MASRPLARVLLSGLGAAAALHVAACGDSSSPSQPPVEAGVADAAALDGAPAADAASTDASPEAAVDAGMDVDNGMPSTSYPAPHPPLPTLTNANGGAILKKPKVVLITYPGYPYAAQLETFAQKLSASTYWAATTGEYGVGALSYGSPVVLTGQTAPTALTSAQIQTWIEGELQSGALGTPDPQTIYTVVYPSTTKITQPNPVSSFLPAAQSCSAFGGYHDNAQVTPDSGPVQNYAYAVIPTCGTNVNALTAVLSHEWVEASTDPYLTSTGLFTLTGGPLSAFYNVDASHTIWAVLGGGEAGDLCEPEAPDVYYTPTDVGNQVQRTWSNLAAAASHDPCVPGLAGKAFFDSAPVLPETVHFTASLPAIDLMTQGITIPVGQSKTIEVDLFSDGDTGGPWTVQADDLLYKYYGSYGVPQSLSFAWDRTQGVNGEKLHLTITVTAASIVGNGHGFVITSKLGSRVTVWPGMIVE